MKSIRFKRWLLVLGLLLGVMAVGGSYLRTTITRGPYLQEGSPTGLVIRWQTRQGQESTVRYGLSPGELVQRQRAQMRGTDHAVLLSGLAPGTRYYYSVEASRGLFSRKPQVHSFVTPPEIGSTPPVRVWVLGDSGTQQREQQAVRDAFYRFCGGPRADLWLMLGDNAYRQGTDAQYQEALFDFYPDLLCAVPIWPTLGNHDARSADPVTQTGVYFDLFTLPAQGQCGGVMSGTEAYYAFNHANVHFICLDSEGSDRSPGGPMLTWLKQDLKANEQTWTVAFWHQPPYTKGSHDSDLGRQMQEMREHALPLLEAAGVDLVMAGHSHNYERSYLLDGHYGTSDTFSETMLRSKGDGRPAGSGPYVKPTRPSVAHTGTVYVVAGSSGQTGRLRATPHPAMCVSLNVAGSLVLDVAGLRLEARFLDDSGQVRDHFVILKENVANSGFGG